MSAATRHHGPGAAGHPAPARAEDRGDAGGEAVRLTPPRARVDPRLVKALARAFRWQRLLERAYASISEMAGRRRSTAAISAGCCG